MSKESLKILISQIKEQFESGEGIDAICENIISYDNSLRKHCYALCDILHPNIDSSGELKKAIMDNE